MKRVVVRIVALTVVIGGGLGVVTQAQRALRSRGEQATAAPAQPADASSGNEVHGSSKLLAEMTGDVEPATMPDDSHPFGGGRRAADPAASAAYRGDADWDSEEADASQAYTERPLPQEGDDSLPLARGQSLDEGEEPVPMQRVQSPAGRLPARTLEPDQNVMQTRYDEPARLEPTSEEPLDEQPLEAADELEPQAAPPVDDYSSEDLLPSAANDLGDGSDGSVEPLADADELEPLPSRAQPETSRRRYGGDVADSSRYEPRQFAEEPLPTPAAVPLDEPPANLRNTPAVPPVVDTGSIEGSGRPGQTELEGPQSHSLQLEKHFPADAQVGSPAAIEIKLRNAGTAVARQLEIVDSVPQGTRLVATRPQADVDANGAVRWAIASLKPGEEVSVTLEVLPLIEGELGSVATVHYAAEASARATVTRPVVALTVTGPKQVLVGEDATFSVKVANNGTGVARGVLLSNRIPAGLTHPSGNELEYEVGDLAPGDSREVQLTLRAKQAGRYVNAIRAVGEGEAQAEDRSEVEVTAPLLTLELGGGTRRYLELPAKFTIAVANNGTAAARGVEIAAELPAGLDFVEATHHGAHDSQAHVVRWSLEELPAGQVGSVELTLRPSVEGEQKLILHAFGEPLATVEKTQAISVEGIATTMFEVVDVEDPVELGGETSYEIRVVNQGTKAASNVQIVAVLPDGMEAVDATGPTRYQIDGQKVLFAGLERLAPKADTSYRIRVKALKPGEQRVQVQLLTDDMRTPVSEEESTRVYSNE